MKVVPIGEPQRVPFFGFKPVRVWIWAQIFASEGRGFTVQGYTISGLPPDLRPDIFATL